jgi:hypothetical protein
MNQTNQGLPRILAAVLASAWVAGCSWGDPWSGTAKFAFDDCMAYYKAQERRGGNYRKEIIIHRMYKFDYCREIGRERAKLVPIFVTGP